MTTERMQGAIHVRELDTTARPMFEGICAWHGSLPPVMSEAFALKLAQIHAAALHGTHLIDLDVHYLDERAAAAKEGGTRDE